MRIKHGVCGKEWTGSNTSHCGGCHETFTSLTAFDQHFIDHRCTAPAGRLTRKGEPLYQAVERDYGTVWGLASERPSFWSR